jgi:hypothetical protein
MANQLTFSSSSNTGPLTERQNSFFRFKEIQRSYNFIVYFDETKDDIVSNLPSFMCTGIEMPEYSFKKEYMYYGPFVKSFPILDHNGFEFSLKLEEDNEGNVKNLINYLVNKNIKKDGYYNTYKDTVLNQIVASVYTHDGWNVYKNHFRNCFFLRSSTVNYTWNSSEKIEYDLTFNCDHFFTQWNEQVPNEHIQEVIKWSDVGATINKHRAQHDKHN